MPSQIAVFNVITVFQLVLEKRFINYQPDITGSIQVYVMVVATWSNPSAYQFVRSLRLSLYRQKKDGAR
jgi:hypothetical protein